MLGVMLLLFKTIIMIACATTPARGASVASPLRALQAQLASPASPLHKGTLVGHFARDAPHPQRRQLLADTGFAGGKEDPTLQLELPPPLTLPPTTTPAPSPTPPASRPPRPPGKFVSDDDEVVSAPVQMLPLAPPQVFDKASFAAVHPVNEEERPRPEADERVTEFADTLWTLPQYPGGEHTGELDEDGVPLPLPGESHWISLNFSVDPTQLQGNDVLQVFSGDSSLNGTLVRQWTGRLLTPEELSSAARLLEDDPDDLPADLQLVDPEPMHRLRGSPQEIVDVFARSVTIRLHRAVDNTTGSTGTGAGAIGGGPVFAVTWFATQACPDGWSVRDEGGCKRSTSDLETEWIPVLIGIPGLLFVTFILFLMGPRSWRAHRCCSRMCSCCGDREARTNRKHRTTLEKQQRWVDKLAWGTSHRPKRRHKEEEGDEDATEAVADDGKAAGKPDTSEKQASGDKRKGSGAQTTAAAMTADRSPADAGAVAPASSSPAKAIATSAAAVGAGAAGSALRNDEQASPRSRNHSSQRESSARNWPYFHDEEHSSQREGGSPEHAPPSDAKDSKSPAAVSSHAVDPVEHAAAQALQRASHLCAGGRNDHRLQHFASSARHRCRQGLKNHLAHHPSSDSVERVVAKEQQQQSAPQPPTNPAVPSKRPSNHHHHHHHFFSHRHSSHDSFHADDERTGGGNASPAAHNEEEDKVLHEQPDKVEPHEAEHPNRHLLMNVRAHEVRHGYNGNEPAQPDQQRAGSPLSHSTRSGTRDEAEDAEAGRTDNGATQRSSRSHRDGEKEEQQHNERALDRNRPSRRRPHRSRSPELEEPGKLELKLDKLTGIGPVEHEWSKRLKRELRRTIPIWFLEMTATGINWRFAVQYITAVRDIQDSLLTDRLAAAYLSFALLMSIGALINAWSRIVVIRSLFLELRSAKKLPLHKSERNRRHVAPGVELAFLERKLHHLKVVGLTLVTESLPFACLGFSKLYRFNVVQNNLLLLISCAVSAFWVGSKITRLISIPELRAHIRRLEGEEREEAGEARARRAKKERKRALPEPGDYSSDSEHPSDFCSSDYTSDDLIANSSDEAEEQQEKQHEQREHSANAASEKSMRQPSAKVVVVRPKLVPPRSPPIMQSEQRYSSCR